MEKDMTVEQTLKMEVSIKCLNNEIDFILFISIYETVYLYLFYLKKYMVITNFDIYSFCNASKKEIMYRRKPYNKN